MTLNEQLSYQVRKDLIDRYGSELLINNEFYMDFFDALADPIYVKDLEGVYLYCNTAFCEFCGFDKQTVIENTVYDLFLDGEPERHHQKDVEIVNSGVVQKYEYETTIRGEHKYLSVRKSPFFNEAGEIVGVVGIMRT